MVVCRSLQTAVSVTHCKADSFEINTGKGAEIVHIIDTTTNQLVTIVIINGSHGTIRAYGNHIDIKGDGQVDITLAAGFFCTLNC